MHLDPDDTFEVSPIGNIQDYAYLAIRVKNNSLLDAEERDYINVTIVSTGKANAESSSSALVQIYISDVNDHPSIIEVLLDSM